MTAASTARLFRSPELRDLARLATLQGWSLDRLPGGHVAVQSPNGARVVMSATGYVNRGTLAAKRHEFAQAGLDLDWSRKRARAERRMRRQEDKPMHVQEVERVEPAAVTQVESTPVSSRPRGQRAGGRFAHVGERETLDIGGFVVQVVERADGRWVATTRDYSRKSRYRNYLDADRDALVARIAADVVESPPVLEPQAVAPDAPPFVQARIPESANGTSWHVVQATPEDFPLAAALDALDATMAPALAALEAAGKVDAADLIRAELVRSPLETEALRLYRRVMRGE